MIVKATVEVTVKVTVTGHKVTAATAIATAEVGLGLGGRMTASLILS